MRNLGHLIVQRELLLKEPACSSLHINMQKQVSWVQTAPGVRLQSLHGLGMALGHLDEPFCFYLEEIKPTQ